MYGVAKQRQLFLTGIFYLLPIAQLIGIGGVSRPLTASLLYGYGAGIPYMVSAVLTLVGIGLLFAFKASWTGPDAATAR